MMIDQKRINAMANRIAAGGGAAPPVTDEEKALLTVDLAIDRMMKSLMEIPENIKKVKPQDAQETQVFSKIMDIVENSINPHFADLLEQWGTLEGEEE